MAQKTVAISANDVGVTLECTLTFTDFDPSGASARLYVGHDPSRAMTLSGPVATYVVGAHDLKQGYWPSRVSVTKNGVTVTSEPFTLVVAA